MRIQGSYTVRHSRRNVTNIWGEIILVSNTIEMVADDLFFPEGPRWRADEKKLYFSDVMASKVSRVNEDGAVETVFEPGEFPSGLGFLANGDLLVVATDSREIVRLAADFVAAGGAARSDSMHHADVSTPYETGNNDMVVAPNGTAYAGAYLAGLSEEVPPGPANPSIIIVAP